MKKLKFATILLTTFIMLFSFSAMKASAKGFADGTYTVNYEMKEAHSENTSIADGYFKKPATLIVKNGVQYIQLTVTGSNYIQSLSAPTGPVEIISEDKENFTRVVKFRVDSDLNEPLEMEMHIIVPDLYDMTHIARAVFDVKGVPLAEKKEEKKEEKKDNSNKDEKPKTEVKEEKPKDKPKEETPKEEKPKDSSEGNKDKKEEQDEAVNSEDDEEKDVVEEASNKEEDNQSNEEKELDEVAAPKEEVSEQNDDQSSTPTILLISLISVAVLIAVFILLKRSKRTKS